MKGRFPQHRDEFQMQGIECKKPVSKATHSRIPFYMTSWKKQNSRDSEHISGNQGLELQMTHRNLEDDGTIPYLDCGSGYMTI